MWYFVMTIRRDPTEYALPNAFNCTAAPLSLQNTDYDGYSDDWKQVIQQAAHAASADDTLIIAGEAGTGKATLARAIHLHSDRKDKPLVFADTHQDIALLTGVLEAASGGTLVVRHDGHAPASFMRGVERLYKTFTAPHTRLILCWKLSSNEAPKTQDDSVERLVIPPLRRRASDSVLLAEAFVARAAIWLGREGLTLSPAARSDLARYRWPGNVRQLHTELFKAILHSPSHAVMSPFACADTSPQAAQEAAAPSVILTDANGNLRSLEDIETEIIQFALTHYQTSRSDIARMLGIGRTTLYRKVHQLDS